MVNGPLAYRRSPKVLFRFGILPGRVQRLGNTRSEFGLNCADHLDKIANSKHALSQRITYRRRLLKSGRLNWGRTK
jgi:hypothetical protein